MVVLVEPTDHLASTRWTRRKQASCCNQTMIRGYMRCCLLLEARQSNRCSTKPNLGSAKVVLAITAKWVRISKWGKQCSMAILWTRWDKATPAKTIQRTASNTTTTRPTGTLSWTTAAVLVQVPPMDPTARPSYSTWWISARPQMQTSIRWWWQHSSSIQLNIQTCWGYHQIQDIIQDLQTPQQYPKPSPRPSWESKEQIEESAIQLSLIIIMSQSTVKITFIALVSMPGNNQSIQTLWWTWLAWDLPQWRVHLLLEIIRLLVAEESPLLIAQLILYIKQTEKSMPEASSQTGVDPSEEMTQEALIKAASKTTV